MAINPGAPPTLRHCYMRGSSQLVEYRNCIVAARAAYAAAYANWLYENQIWQATEAAAAAQAAIQAQAVKVAAAQAATQASIAEQAVKAAALLAVDTQKQQALAKAYASGASGSAVYAASIAAQKAKYNAYMAAHAVTGAHAIMVKRAGLWAAYLQATAYKNAVANTKGHSVNTLGYAGIKEVVAKWYVDNSSNPLVGYRTRAQGRFMDISSPLPSLPGAIPYWQLQYMNNPVYPNQPPIVTTDKYNPYFGGSGRIVMPAFWVEPPEGSDQYALMQDLVSAINAYSASYPWAHESEWQVVRGVIITIVESAVAVLALVAVFYVIAYAAGASYSTAAAGGSSGAATSAGTGTALSGGAGSGGASIGSAAVSGGSSAIAAGGSTTAWEATAATAMGYAKKAYTVYSMVTGMKAQKAAQAAASQQAQYVAPSATPSTSRALSVAGGYSSSKAAGWVALGMVGLAKVATVYL